ncbi:MAG: hypothetical protein RRC34_06635 [Lentisphaeria bacterium]|nr:hypothetical protein [Lentisphaeria bacterium]
MMQLEERRKKWLEKAESLAVEMDRLRDAVEDARRAYGPAPEENMDELVPQSQASIAKLCGELAEIEREETPCLGSLALLAEEPAPVIRRALTVLILGCLTDRFTGTRCDVVSLGELAAPTDLMEKLTLRRAFRNDNALLREMITLDMGRGGDSLGTAWLRLKENAFNRALGLPNDNEFAML